jgi:hypothetical protein
VAHAGECCGVEELDNDVDFSYLQNLFLLTEDANLVNHIIKFEHKALKEQLPSFMRELRMRFKDAIAVVLGNQVWIGLLPYRGPRGEFPASSKIRFRYRRRRSRNHATCLFSAFQSETPEDVELPPRREIILTEWQLKSMGSPEDFYKVKLAMITINPHTGNYLYLFLGPDYQCF